MAVTPVYNIDFAVSGIILCVLVFIFVSIYYPSGPTLKSFQTVIVLTVIGATSDVITGYYCAFPGMMPNWLSYFLNSLCLVLGAWTTYAIIRYLSIYMKEKHVVSKEVAVPTLLSVVSVLFSFLFVINIFVPFIFSIDENGAYVHGDLYPIVFILPVIYIFYAGHFTIVRKAYLLPRQIKAIIIYIIFALLGVVLQFLLFNNVLLIYYFSSLAVLCMAFTLESPDYIKLKETMDELKEANVLAESATKAKDYFLANISHEIRTPLNAILGMDSMIIRETKDAKTYRYAKNIRSAGNTLLSIINDLLDFSKMETGKMELVINEYKSASVINDVRNMTIIKAQAKKLDYIVKIAENFPVSFRGDEVRIRQIMLNLIGNAIKYTNEGSVSVDISCANQDQDNSMLVIRVSDTGIGIRTEDKQKLFESFKRLDEIKNRRIEGTGLGLAITKQLVDLMGGSISVDSEYGKGSVFTAVIPQPVVGNEVIDNINKIFENSESAVREESVKIWAPEAKILVVDDNDMNLEVFVDLLSVTEINIDAVNTGEACIELCEKNKYDIIFLDQMMTGMDGLETLRIMKERKLASGTPVIMFTADAVVGARERYVDIGFDDYMTKPVSLSRVEEVLRLYLPPEKIKSAKETKKKNEVKSKLIVIDDSKEKLDSHKECLGEYDATFVLDATRAKKYMTKHNVDYVLISREEYERIIKNEE